MKRPIPPRSLLVMALGSACSSAGWAHEIQATAIEVIGTTPLAGIGLERRQVPANVQSLNDTQLEEMESVSLAEAMARRLPSVNLNETQGNPYQADLNYRGFSASPLLGMAQGLSVYVDGVRVNEPFGDTVNWDLLPHSALAGIDLIPGSNPVFGLNTLGGALAIRTKNGFSHPGGKLEMSGGSFGRSNSEFEWGGNSGPLAAYVAGDWFREDGWRDYSPSDVKQLFAKLSWRNAQGEADLTLTKARSRLVGNGLVPQSLLSQRRENIFTHPDETRNDMTQLAASGQRWLAENSSLSGSLYYRRTGTHTLNGDMNAAFEEEPSLAPGALHRTQTTQHSMGGALQWNLSTARHQLAFGASVDRARVRFGQTQQLGQLDATRGISDWEALQDENALRGSTRTASLFVSDTMALGQAVHVTAAARYNQSHVVTFDELRRNVPNLDGDHRYRKLNPALGITWQIAPYLDVYAGLSQGTRIPTPIELGCADPANPCTLPNSMAADPYLKQVVSRTIEAGLRGHQGEAFNWQAGLYRTLNRDDILFVGTSTSAGYFTNYGQTLRQGLEFGLNGRFRQVDWLVNYSWLQASFRSSACLLGANNSTRGSAPECTAGGQNDEILVRQGDKIPGLPVHSFKFGLAWSATDWLRLSGDVQAFSGQFARGNENNQHQPGRATDIYGSTRDFAGQGRIPGYAILNLQAEARLGGGWQLFGKLNNVFDKRYATAAALAENPFVATSNGFATNADLWQRETFVAPGAPRAGWLGLRYVFGGR